MSMARGATSTLLVLSLEALRLLVVVVVISAAAASGDSETDIIIRLPTHVTGGGGVADRVTHDGEKRPWECCDKLLCAMVYPPICRCIDLVDRCSSACKQCKETIDGRHTCADWYHSQVGEEIPQCHQYGAPHGPAAAARVTKGDDEEKGRPWKCCNRAICTKSFPPTCYCMDKVKQCASTCEHCEQVEGSGGSQVYSCIDGYRGEPGPRCDEEDKWAPAVASAHRFFLDMTRNRKE